MRSSSTLRSTRDEVTVRQRLCNSGRGGGLRPRSPSWQPPRDLTYQPPRQRKLVHARQPMRARVVQQRDLVGVAAERVLGAVGNEQRQTLAPALFLSEPFDVVALRREADAERWIRTRRDRGQDVERGLERERQHVARLLELLG